jgi:tetratricopeptide (TPR) repeat protein
VARHLSLRRTGNERRQTGDLAAGAARLRRTTRRCSLTGWNDAVLLTVNGCPFCWTAHAMLAVLAWKRGGCASAVEHFGKRESAITAQPEAQYGQARYALALSLLDTSRPRQAIDALQPLVESPDPDPAALELSSAAHEAMGETPKAVALLRQAIVRGPGNVNLYLDFASLSFAHQSFHVEIDMIDAGLRRTPDSAPLYLARGVLHSNWRSSTRPTGTLTARSNRIPNSTGRRGAGPFAKSSRTIWARPW